MRRLGILDRLGIVLVIAGVATVCACKAMACADIFWWLHR